MLNKNKTGLLIFDNFVIDNNLSKFKNNNLIPNTNPSVFMLDSSSSFISGNKKTEVEEYFDYLSSYSKQSNIFYKFKLKLFKKLYEYFFDRKIKEQKQIKLNSENVFQFFKKIKENVKELDIDENIIDKYNIIVANAFKANQTALLEKINRQKHVILNESKLIKNKFKKVIEEQIIVDFYNNFKLDEKILKLTWIKNFVRVIPDDIIKIKEKVDKLEIFDNYVILHYDKNNDQTELTKKEIEKLRDPILFGVMKNSRKLYYIADWEDEYCDLTLDKMIKQMKLKVKDIDLNKKILNI